MPKPKTKTEPGTVIRRIEVDDLRSNPDAIDLFSEHWDEIAKNKRVMRLAPNWKKYYALEEQGMTLILGMYAVQRGPYCEVLIGYSVNFITEHMHYKDLKICQNDLLFMQENWRSGRHGLRLILATEAAAKEREAQLMLWHAKPETTLDAILPRMRYQTQDIIYSKEL